MEYVAGGTLEQFCVPENLLPLDKIVEIIFKCTRALDFAHKLGVTHRDIKPANILLVGGTDIKISDFGSALIGDRRHHAGHRRRLARLHVAAAGQGAAARPPAPTSTRSAS